jgi:hypothetical protein
VKDCPICDGPLYLIGVLGNLVHFRCRDCGMDCSEPASEHQELIEALRDEEAM